MRSSTSPWRTGHKVTTAGGPQSELHDTLINLTTAGGSQGDRGGGSQGGLREPIITLTTAGGSQGDRGGRVTR